MPDYQPRQDAFAAHMAATGVSWPSCRYPRPGVPDRLAAPGADVRQHRVRAQLGDRVFLAPGREPVFVLPRMVKEFDLPDGVSGDGAWSMSATTPRPSSGGRQSPTARSPGWASALGPGQTPSWVAAGAAEAELGSASLLVNLMRRVKSERRS